MQLLALESQRLKRARDLQSFAISLVRTSKVANYIVLMAVSLRWMAGAAHNRTDGASFGLLCSHLLPLILLLRMLLK